MSGGSYNYTCYTFQNEYEGYMYDDEMNDLVKDLSKVLHDLEWWQSGDIGEEGYREENERISDLITDLIDSIAKHTKDEKMLCIQQMNNIDNFCQKREFKILKELTEDNNEQGIAEYLNMLKEINNQIDKIYERFGG